MTKRTWRIEVDPAWKDGMRSPAVPDGVTRWEVVGAGSPVPGASGYAVPGAFTVRAERDDHVRADIIVAVEGGRAKAASVTVSTNEPAGVTSSTLRAVELRPLIGRAMLDVLHKVELTTSGANIVPIDEPDEAARDAVTKLAVRYVREEPTPRKTSTTKAKRLGRTTTTRARTRKVAR